ncbi:MAG: hypothetical protein ACJ788_06465 [Ktedonobacteraceae bacterium]
MEQHFRLAARFVQIEDRVHHLAHIGGSLGPRAFRLREQRGNPFPRSIADIGWVWQTCRVRTDTALLSGVSTSFVGAAHFVPQGTIIFR